MGWAWLAAIKDRHDVHVLTARYQRDWIEAEVRNKPAEFSHVRFHYVEPPLWAYDYSSGFWRWQANIPLLVPLFHRYYHRWMRAAYKTARELNRRFQFDLVHQLTFVGFRFPRHLGKLGIPIVGADRRSRKHAVGLASGHGRSRRCLLRRAQPRELDASPVFAATAQGLRRCRSRSDRGNRRNPPRNPALVRS